MSEIDGLVDTSVLVDLSRGKPQARQWAAQQGERVLGLHMLVSMELAEGVRDKEELARLDRMLERYALVILTPSDCLWAVEQHRKFWLSHNAGLLDTLIAATAVRLDVPLYTLNLKHFQPLPNVKAIHPY
jgi:hypothetical protein